jgi:DNA-binding XRE family transcriptional regulator
MHHMSNEQSNEPLVNYLRLHRRDAGLTQEELGRVIGYKTEGSVGSHERFDSVPPFLIALGYEVLFREPAGQIFLGLKQTMEVGIEARLAELEISLRTTLEKTPHLVAINRKLEWIEARRRIAEK